MQYLLMNTQITFTSFINSYGIHLTAITLLSIIHIFCITHTVFVLAGVCECEPLIVYMLVSNISLKCSSANRLFK